MGLSIRAYARHRGVSHVAVKKAIDTGRITPLPDGTIDPVAADAQWAANTTPTRRSVAAEPQEAPQLAAATRETPQAPTSASNRTQREVADPPTPALSTGGTSLLQARTVNEVLKAQLNKVSLAERKKELVDRAQAVAHVFKLARVERDAWLNWPARVSAQIAIKVQADPHLLHIALEAAVRDHLQELGEMRPRVD